MIDDFATKRLTRKQREQQFRVNLVLDAALEIFAQKPFAQATVEEIGERAELSVGTLYNLFGSKENIYKNVVSRQQDAFFERIERRMVKETSPTQQITGIIEDHFDHFAENLAAWRFHVYATAGLSSDLRNELFAEAQASLHAFLIKLTELCERGIESGEFKSGLPPHLMAISVNSIPHSFLQVIFERNDGEIRALLPAALEATTRIVGTTSPR